MAKSKVYACSDDEFRNIIQTSSTYSECLRRFGLGTNGSHSRDALKRRIRELGCSVGHFHHPTPPVSHKMELSEILVENSPIVCTSRLKNRLTNEEILKNQCAICGLTDWLGKPLALQIHHINGVRIDNRIENLQILCPNCHSQTDNYGSKNIRHTPKLKPIKIAIPRIQKRKFEVSKEELEYLICNFSMLTVAKKFGVSDNAVRKRCKFYGLPYKRDDIIALKNNIGA